MANHPKMRNEIKFILKPKDLLRLREKLEVSLFQKKYEDRKINNIYFDSYNHKSFNENIEGFNRRTKFRARWYGHNDIFSLDKINIEKKCKWNGLGWKEKFVINFVSNRKLEQIVNYLKRNHDYFCVPIISNSYEREYFENTQGVRITIDKNILYFKPGSLFQKRESYFVLEIKFDKDSLFDSSILNGIDLIISKNSKYVNGLNIFKKQ